MPGVVIPGICPTSIGISTRAERTAITRIARFTSQETVLMWSSIRERRPSRALPAGVPESPPLGGECLCTATHNPTERRRSSGRATCSRVTDRRPGVSPVGAPSRRRPASLLPSGTRRCRTVRFRLWLPAPAKTLARSIYSELPPACAGGFLRVSGDHRDPRTCLSQITGELSVARPQGIL
jgi:hypothetical protein